MIDLTGKRFGRLTVLHVDRDNRTDKFRSLRWVCRCDCGNTTVVNSGSLRRGNTRSCGCLAREELAARHLTHGKRRHPLYNTWCSMKQRCYVSSAHSYRFYGARGIEVCDEWKDDFESFYEWAMANGYEPGLTIDRIDYLGNYCPENCRWATIDEQANNRRNNRYITAFGKTQTLAQWARELKINRATILYRLDNGWTTEDALTTPVGALRRYHEA